MIKQEQNFNLLENGDGLERYAYPLFLKDSFPSYEKFWKIFIVPLTNRPENINSKNDKDLQKIFPKETLEVIHERMVILQLHYSVLSKLVNAYGNIIPAKKDMFAVESFFSCIYSALDISAEMFGRFSNLKNGKVSSDAFDPSLSVKISRKVRKEWQEKHPYPLELKDARDYRDLILHGFVFASIATPQAGFIALPRPSKIENYLDWRKVFTSKESKEGLIDFLYTGDIINPLFEHTISFLELEWQKNLLK